MPARRDPLSIEMDPYVRRALMKAIRSKPRAADIFVASPIRQFTDLDRGRRTANERAYTRSAYYQVFKVPRNFGVPPAYGLDLTWGPIERRGRRWGRMLHLRLFTAGSAGRHVTRKVSAPWSEDVGFGDWRDGSRRSMPGDRIDSNRRGVG